MGEGHLWLELLIIILLVCGNAVCSLAEIAIVGARKTKLQELAEEGNKGAVYALQIADNKEELFSTIQVGITTISILTGMFSGASLAGPLGDELARISVLAPYARTIAMTTVMVVVTYVSLILGELVPKWIAISMPEEASCIVARPMILFATMCRPLVSFSTWSTKIVVGLMGIHMGGEQPVTEEEIKVLIEQGARAGAFDVAEPMLVDHIFQLDVRTAADSMTARPQLHWLDLEDSEEKLWDDIIGSNHYRLPVGKASLDDFKGLAATSEILLDQHKHPDKAVKASIMDTVHTTIFIPETLTLSKVLNTFRQKGVHEAVVIDEYGALSGLLTLHDVLEAIVGDMPGDEEDVLEEKNKFIRRTKNSWLVEGLCSIDEFRDFFHMNEKFPGETEDYYKTLGGFITYLFGYIPRETDTIRYGKFTFEVMDRDDRRIDKVLVTVDGQAAKKGNAN